MSDLIDRQAVIDAVEKLYRVMLLHTHDNDLLASIAYGLEHLPSAEPEIVQCYRCGFWDRDTLRHQSNDFRDWNEAECLILAERDPYHEINRYTEADDFCSRADRRHDG